MSSPETNPEKRGYLDNLGRLARLYLPRIILGSLLGAAIGWGGVGLANLAEAVNEQDIRIDLLYSPSTVSEGNRWFIEHDREVVIFGAFMGAGGGLAWARAAEEKMLKRQLEVISKPYPLRHSELDSESHEIPKQVRDDGFEIGSSV